MILQVLAHRRVAQHVDAHILQQRARTDSRKLQDLRAAYGAGRQHDLGRAQNLRLAVGHHLQPGGAAALEDHAPHMHAGHHRQVRALHRRAQEGAGQRVPPAVLLVDAEIADAFVVAAVEIVTGGDADCLRGAGEIVQHLPAQALPVHAPRAIAGMRVRCAGRIALGSHEIGQHVVPAPAGAAHLPPAVIIRRLPPDIEHAVDRRAAAQHPPARIKQAAAAEARFGLGAEAPVGARIVDAVKIADRDVDPRIIVAPAGLEQQHAQARILAEAGRQHASGTAGTGDDDVVHARPFLLAGLSLAAPGCDTSAAGAWLDAWQHLSRRDAGRGQL